MKLNDKGYAITLIVFGILIVFVVVLSTLLITMNNSVKLNKTVKESVVENIQLSADTSGMSLTERIEQLELQMSNIKKEVYPVGSIYMSAEDDTVEKVKARFGGTWEKYAQGRTLIGSGTDDDGNIFLTGQTGGSSVVSLSTSNIPSHSHSYTPSGKVTSTFTGSSVTTSSSGNHAHSLVDTATNVIVGPSTTSGGGTNSFIGSTLAITGYPGISTTTTGSHTHTVSAQGTVSSTFTGTSSNTGSVGSGTSFSIQNPYITVYMYKRIN